MSGSDGGAAPPDSTVIRILGLAGSLRATSTTRMAVRWALRGAQKEGAKAELLDIAGYDLPFLGQERNVMATRGLERYLADLRASDGIILGSPEIHGSVSGVLKNALDLTDRGLFEGKMLGLIGVAGGRMGASETLSHLRAIGRSLHAWVVPNQVSIAAADGAFDSRGEPLRAEVGDRLEAVGRQVAHFARLHKCGNHLQFLKDWEGAGVQDGEARGAAISGP